MILTVFVKSHKNPRLLLVGGAAMSGSLIVQFSEQIKAWSLMQTFLVPFSNKKITEDGLVGRLAVSLSL